MFMTYMSAVHYMCACCLQRSEDGVGFPGTGIVDGWSFSVNVRPEYSVRASALHF